MTEPVLGTNKSARGQAWVYRASDQKQVDDFKQQTGLDEIRARLLVGRDIEFDQVDQFLEPTLRGSMPDPSSIKDMDLAASLIVDAISDGKKITVFADYDVDGATSAAQLIRWGRHFGHEFDIYVPDRIEEGYGPNIEAFRALKNDGVDLVITVDCGAAAHDPLKEAVSLDLPIIVIDHHMMHGDHPPAAALVNPNREDDTSGLGHLAAAGVTFMLLAALNRESRRRDLGEGPNLLDLLGLTALGTICDVVPLKNVNRAFARQGLKALGKGNIIGINALADVAGVAAPFNNYHAGFVLGPRINAGGRIGQARMGAELLSTENGQTAYGHAAELDRVNVERKRIQDDILRECQEQVLRQSDQSGPIILAMDGWHPGVIGVVAGRIKDQFYRPTIIIGIDGETGKGSGRSVRGIDLGGAILAAKDSGLLRAGGGHAMAGGLTIDVDKIEEFQSFMQGLLKDEVAQALSERALKVDALIAPMAVNMSLLNVIDQVGPYGAEHPQPVFVIPDLRLDYAKTLRGGHMRVSLINNAGQKVEGICFGAEESGLADAILSADKVPHHFAVRVVRNAWQGRERADIHILDLAPA